MLNKTKNLTDDNTKALQPLIDLLFEVFMDWVNEDLAAEAETIKNKSN